MWSESQVLPGKPHLPTSSKQNGNFALKGMCHFWASLWLQTVDDSLLLLSLLRVLFVSYWLLLSAGS